MAFQQLPEEADGRPPIAPGLHEDVDDIALFVHGPPQILLPPVDLHKALVQISGLAHTASAAPQPPSVVEPERPTPLANCLIRDDHTAFGEEILDISEAQAETVVEPDGMTDDIRGISVSAVARRLARHRTTLPPAAST